MCPTEVLSFGPALVAMAAAGAALKAAADTAVQLIPVQWYSAAHGLVQVAGLDRVTCLLGCLGLCLALLCVTCATAVPALVGPGTVPFLGTAGPGLAIFLGCALWGSLLGWTWATLAALGLRGFCFSGFIFGLILLVLNRRRMADAPSRLLVLPAVTLLTMFLGVWSGRAVDLRQPKVCLVNVLVAPAAALTGLLVTVLTSRSRDLLTFTFVLLVPFSGLLIGLGSQRHGGEEPLLHHTHYTIQFSVYTLEILTGGLGALGGIYVSLGAPGRAGWLACWISVPAALTLVALDRDRPHADVLSGARGGVGAAGLLGLTSGLAAASGVALGLVLGQVLGPRGAPVLEAAGGASRQNRRLLVEVVEHLALLAVVMMGSAVLGVAGFLTASLGPPGLIGTVLAAIIATLRALYMLSEQR